MDPRLNTCQLKCKGSVADLFTAALHYIDTILLMMISKVDKKAKERDHKRVINKYIW